MAQWFPLLISSFEFLDYLLLFISGSLWYSLTFLWIENGWRLLALMRRLQGLFQCFRIRWWSLVEEFVVQVVVIFDSNYVCIVWHNFANILLIYFEDLWAWKVLLLTSFIRITMRVWGWHISTFGVWRLSSGVCLFGFLLLDALYFFWLLGHALLSFFPNGFIRASLFSNSRCSIRLTFWPTFFSFKSLSHHSCDNLSADLNWALRIRKESDKLGNGKFAFGELFIDPFLLFIRYLPEHFFKFFIFSFFLFIWVMWSLILNVNESVCVHSRDWPMVIILFVVLGIWSWRECKLRCIISSGCFIVLTFCRCYIKVRFVIFLVSFVKLYCVLPTIPSVTPVILLA